MKHPVPVVLFIALLASGCGKVGDPRPPKIRRPAAILDLKATQDKTNVVLTWTNPQRYVDGSNATDLLTVRILQNGTLLTTVPVSGPGKPQTYSIDTRGALGTTPVYTLEVVTERGKKSAVSTEARIAVMELPGIVSNLKGGMDQHRIRLEWQVPTENPLGAEVYQVRREDNAFPPVTVTELFWEDRSAEPGKTYRYVVTAGKGTASPVFGPPSPPLSVLAKDEVRPAAPKGLTPPVVSDSGANLQWNPNTEEDVAGYYVYRSDNPESGWVQLGGLWQATYYPDAGYRPGSFYSVSAVDEAGNTSDKSAPVRAP